MDPEKIQTLLEIMQEASEATEASNPKEAADLYVEAISILETGLTDVHIARAKSWVAAGDPERALMAANTAVKRNLASPAAWFCKGSALLEAGKPADAKVAFQKSIKYQKDPNLKTSYEDWLSRCEKALEDKAAQSNSENPSPAKKPPPAKTSATSKDSAKPKEPVPTADRDVPMSDASETPAQPTPPPPPQGDPRMQWYQSGSHVNVDIYAKNVVREESSIDFTETSVKLLLRRPGCEDYTLELVLAESIVPDASSFSLSRFKVELRLKKQRTSMNWKSLDAAGKIVSAAIEASMLSRRREDRNSERQKGLAQMADEELKDYNEDDSAMGLFRTLYKDADEDTRRAMMKSYSESGGQVLSTNWDEVSKKKVVYEGKD